MEDPAATLSVPIYFFIVFLVFLLGIIIGWTIRHLGTLQKDIFAIKLDSLFFYISIPILLFSFIAQGFGIFGSLSGSILNIFTTMIFSWLLTKSSSRAEFKEQEEQLARRSHRHMSGISSETKRSIEVLREALEHATDEPSKSALTTTLHQLIYIHSGINACNEDWYDLLSTDDQTRAKTTKDEQGDLSKKIVSQNTCVVDTKSRDQESDFA